MDRGSKYHGYVGRYTMGRGQNTMSKGNKIQWISGSIYHGQGVVKIPWVGGSKHHRSACIYILFQSFEGTELD